MQLSKESSHFLVNNSAAWDSTARPSLAQGTDALGDRPVGPPGWCLSSQVFLSMVCARLPVAGRGTAHAGKASPASPPPHPYLLPRVPLRPPPVLCRREVAAQRGGWSRSRVPGVHGPCSPAGRSRWIVPRSISPAVGESILKGGGETWVQGASGCGIAGVGTLLSERVEVRSLSRSRACADCCRGLSMERPERVSGWGVSATTGLVLHLGSWALASGTLQSRVCKVLRRWRT